MRLAALYADWRVARYLSGRGQLVAAQWLVLRRDGSLWTCPQQQLQALTDALLNCGAAEFDLQRVRIWRGLRVASPRVVWRPQAVVDFRLFWRAPVFLLRPMEAVETSPAQFRAPVNCAGQPSRADTAAGTHSTARLGQPLDPPAR